MTGERELRDAFAEIQAPPGVDRWRDRLVSVGHHEDHHHDVVVPPRPHRRRSLAVAAAVIAVVGLGGAVVTSGLLAGAPLDNPTMALADHAGDLRITTPGQVITGLRVTGTVIVDAPGVTLRRVVVVAPSGPAVRQLAADLTIVDSELTGGTSVTQLAPGLVLRHSRAEHGVDLTSGAELTGNHLEGSTVSIRAGATGVTLRHNVMGVVTMSDVDGPIRDVTIQDSVLARVDAPSGPGSGGIRVLDNRFSGGSPSTGWRAAYRWSGNTYLDGGAPAGP